MPAATKLTDAEVQTALEGLPGWSLRNGKLHRELKLGNFVEAFGLMTQIALVAESMDHHPEWFNVYSTLRIDLTTHDCGGISHWDISLAQRIDALAAGFAKSPSAAG